MVGSSFETEHSPYENLIGFPYDVYNYNLPFQALGGISDIQYKQLIKKHFNSTHWYTLKIQNPNKLLRKFATSFYEIEQRAKITRTSQSCPPTTSAAYT